MDLQNFFYTNIPVIETNEFRIEHDGEKIVRTFGSIEKHFNHKNIAFGGSISTAMTISAFGYVQLLLEEAGLLNASVVIKECHVRFLKPVKKNFTAVSVLLDDSETKNLVEELRKNGKISVVIQSYAVHQEETVKTAAFSGVFVIKLL